MQIVLVGLIDEPDIALVARAAPIMLRTVLPAIEDRFVLPLVISAPEREGILGPDHEGRPFAPGLAERFLQRVELRGGHADVDGALGDSEDVHAGVVEERAKTLAKGIV